MTDGLPAQSGRVGEVVEQYSRGRPLALLFDYDGTLTPIVRHPSLARLSAATRDRLQRLAGTPNVRVGVVSGRALADVRELVGVSGLYYAGSGGLEVDLRGTIERDPHTESVRSLMDELVGDLQDLLRKYPGTWVERKPGVISLHYRDLLPLPAVCFQSDVAGRLATFDRLRHRVVSRAIEVGPVGGWDKGTAVTTILGHIEGECGRRPVPMYFGDAPNDAEGMAAVSAASGVSVGIGPDAPAVADFRLPDPDALAALLDELVAVLAAGRPQPDGRPVGMSGQSTPADPRPDEEPGLLIVDSDDELRTELADEMTGLGWKVWQADTAERAAEVAAHAGDRIRVALVDLQLPGLQGARVLAELGRHSPALIRCFLTTEIRPYTVTAFGRLSDFPLFTKPVRPVELNAALRQLLRGRPQVVV